MWLMLQQDQPDDYVVASGETHSVQEFLEEAFRLVDLDWREHVEFDSRYLRPAEVDLLLGDASKARTRLGWRPRVGFHDLVRMMIDSDGQLAREEAVILKHREAELGRVYP
jgi:GDPmannose 4,6-dehydratase